MSEMTERVSRAMKAKARTYEIHTYEMRMLDEEWEGVARAAIAVMRDATDTMVWEGLYNADGINMLGVNANSLAAAWERMIDAALTQQNDDREGGPADAERVA